MEGDDDAEERCNNSLSGNTQRCQRQLCSSGTATIRYLVWLQPSRPCTPRQRTPGFLCLEDFREVRNESLHMCSARTPSTHALHKPNRRLGPIRAFASSQWHHGEPQVEEIGTEIDYTGSVCVWPAEVQPNTCLHRVVFMHLSIVLPIMYMSIVLPVSHRDESLRSPFLV